MRTQPLTPVAPDTAIVVLDPIDGTPEYAATVLRKVRATMYRITTDMTGQGSGDVHEIPRSRIMLHADYPHTPGYLIDCAACEAICHCNVSAVEAGRQEPCVYCGENAGQHAADRGHLLHRAQCQGAPTRLIP